MRVRQHALDKAFKKLKSDKTTPMRERVAIRESLDAQQKVPAPLPTTVSLHNWRMLSTKV